MKKWSYSKEVTAEIWTISNPRKWPPRRSTTPFDSNEECFPGFWRTLDRIMRLELSWLNIIFKTLWRVLVCAEVYYKTILLASIKLLHGAVARVENHSLRRGISEVCEVAEPLLSIIPTAGRSQVSWRGPPMKHLWIGIAHYMIGRSTNNVRSFWLITVVKEGNPARSLQNLA